MNAANDLHALTGAYAVDALDDLERVRFERHMVDCEDCAAEVRSLREAATLLAGTVATPPSPMLRERTLAAARTVRPLPPTPAPAEVVRRHAHRFPRLVAAAVAAVVLVVGGGVALSQRQESAPPVAVAQRVQDAADSRIQSVTFADGSKATLYHSRSVGRAVLVTKDMASTPEGKSYELWFKKDGAFVPAGLMTDGGDQTVALHGRLGDANAVGITVEPASGSEHPTTSPIAVFDLKKSV